MKRSSSVLFTRHPGSLPPLLWVLAVALVGCAGKPPPPDWKMNAQAALEAYQKHYLNGDTRLAELNHARARTEIGRSGRADLIARAELARCATQMAALAAETCPAAAEAVPEDRVYARFLAGQWADLDAGALPEAYRPLLAARDEAARTAALAGIRDPLSRLIAAGVLLRQTASSPAVIAEAVATASERGWRRPLLAWSRVQLERARAAGDSEAGAAIQRRIDLVEASLPKAP